jgi:hypothetical protein
MLRTFNSIVGESNMSEKLLTDDDGLEYLVCPGNNTSNHAFKIPESLILKKAKISKPKIKTTLICECYSISK